MIEFILFVIFGLFVLVAGAWLIFARSAMHSAVALAGALVGLAIIFLILQTPLFVTLVQLSSVLHPQPHPIHVWDLVAMVRVSIVMAGVKM